MREIIVDADSRQVFYEPLGDITIAVKAGVKAHFVFCGAGSGKTVAQIERDATLTIECVEVGDNNIERVIDITLEGQGADSTVNSIAIARGENCKTLESTVCHSVPNCTSTQNFRAVATDNAVSHFKGLISVKKGADGTVALQQSDNIALSDTAKVLTDPQMLIFAEDVKCNHGATVGRRDEEALFYMQQRGISEKDALGLLLESFCYAKLDFDGFDESDVDKLREVISGSISNI